MKRFIITYLVSFFFINLALSCNIEGLWYEGGREFREWNFDLSKSSVNINFHDQIFNFNIVETDSAIIISSEKNQTNKFRIITCSSNRVVLSEYGNSRIVVLMKPESSTIEQDSLEKFFENGIYHIYETFDSISIDSCIMPISRGEILIDNSIVGITLNLKSIIKLRVTEILEGTIIGESIEKENKFGIRRISSTNAEFKSHDIIGAWQVSLKDEGGLSGDVHEMRFEYDGMGVWIENNVIEKFQWSTHSIGQRSLVYILFDNLKFWLEVISYRSDMMVIEPLIFDCLKFNIRDEGSHLPANEATIIMKRK